MAFRLNRDTWEEIIVSFKIIQEYKVIENDQIVEGPIIDHSGFTGGGTICRGLNIRIVTGDENGTKAYVVKLYDPILGAKLKRSDPIYISILECAQTIVDELNNIISYNHRTVYIE